MKTLTLNDIPPYATEDGETIAISETLQIRVSTRFDESTGEPWKDDEGHGPVSGWERRDKRAGEWLLRSDRWSKLFYDAEEAMKMARRDRWGLSSESKANLSAKLKREPTRGEICAEAVRLDFGYLNDWCEDRWQYIGLIVALERLDKDGYVAEEIAGESLWGVESFGDHWREMALGMAKTLLSCHETECAERAEWEARDTVTVNA